MSVTSEVLSIRNKALVTCSYIHVLLITVEFNKEIILALLQKFPNIQSLSHFQLLENKGTAMNNMYTLFRHTGEHTALLDPPNNTVVSKIVIPI